MYLHLNMGHIHCTRSCEQCTTAVLHPRDKSATTQQAHDVTSELLSCCLSFDTLHV